MFLIIGLPPAPFKRRSIAASLLNADRSTQASASAKDVSCTSVKKVVDELHTRAAASFSGMDHPTSECIEDRCSGRYSVGVAANQEEQLTGFDLVFAAGDRSVEEFLEPVVWPFGYPSGRGREARRFLDGSCLLL
jgi:hypothetical protein